MVYQKPYTFRPGNYAKASEVNANFDTVKDFVDELETKFGAVYTANTPYNKANVNGDSTQVFYCATSSETNACVNNDKLESRLSDLSDDISDNTAQIAENTSNISGLETMIEGITIAPTYTTNTSIPAESGTFANGGLLYLTNGDSVSHNVTLGSFTFTIRANSNVTFPVRQGGTYNLSSFTGNVSRVLFTL